MNEQDHIDNSKWHDMLDTAAEDREEKWKDFLKNEVPYWSNAMLKQAKNDLIDEQNARPSQDNPQPFLDELGKVGRELVEFHKEYDREPF